MPSKSQDRAAPRPPSCALVLGAAAIAMLAGCGGDEGPVGPGVTAERLQFQTQPGSATAGAPLGPPVQIAVLDGAGNVVTGSTALVRLVLDPNPGGAALLGTTSKNAVAGIATFDDLTIETAAAGYTLAASSDGLTRASSPAFGVNPAAPVGLAFESIPTVAEANDPFDSPVEVAVTDAFGNVVTNAEHEIALSLTDHARGGNLQGTVTATAVDGVATFEGLSIDRSGTGYELNAATATLDGTARASLEVRFTWADVRAGELHTCGLQITGRTYCWGSNGYGELGDGQMGIPRATAAAVMGDPTYLAIRSGNDYACAIVPGGEARCWGRNDWGQLGDGAAGANRDIPAPVAGGLEFATLDLARVFTCGLTTEGQAYCWGLNTFGQLGDGNAGTDRDTPGAVLGGLEYSAIRVGQTFACALTPDGDTYCWGRNDRGQLGDGNMGTGRDTPGGVQGGLKFVAIGAGDAHACGLTAAGKAYCWGSNDIGQLGDGNTGTDRDVPGPVAGDLELEALAVGDFHNCGLTSEYVAYCWGNDQFGELGHANMGVGQDTPAVVAGGLQFTAINAGHVHTCAITLQGRAYCWGNNEGGQVGDGTVSLGADTPMRVLDP